MDAERLCTARLRCSAETLPATCRTAVPCEVICFEIIYASQFNIEALRKQSLQFVLLLFSSESTPPGSVRRTVPSGANSWRRLCPVKDAPPDDDDDDV